MPSEITSRQASKNLSVSLGLTLAERLGPLTAHSLTASKIRYVSSFAARPPHGFSPPMQMFITSSVFENSLC